MTREEAIEVITDYLNKDTAISPYNRRFINALDMAIEALSADANQTNGRWINADTLMDLLKAKKQFFVDAYGGSFHCMSEKDKARCDEIDACIASIVNAQTVSADAVQEWIPCSERLPNEDEYVWYLVTVKGHGLFVDVVPFNNKVWEGLSSRQEVIAWMPLPEPYKEDGE